MKRLIQFNSFLIVLLAFSIQLHAQFNNKNEYLKLNEELFCQNSPIEKGRVISKFDKKTHTYIKQEYSESLNTKKAVFSISTYKDFGYSGQIISEKAVKPSTTNEVVAAEIKKQNEEEEAVIRRKAEEEEFQRLETLSIQSDELKTAIMNSKLKFTFQYGNDYNPYRENQYFYDFPLKYYNGTQPFLQNTKDYDFDFSIINNGSISSLTVDNSENIYAIGSSNRKERFMYYGKFNLANINLGYFNQIGFAQNSYDNKYYLITKKFTLSNTLTSCVSSQIIPFSLIFPENPEISAEVNPDIKKQNVEILWYSRLSNNNIIILLKTNIEYLSNQLNSMFGINGINKISRTFETDSYYKFIVLSEDGSKLYANKNYIIPIKFIRPIDNGFIILSEKLGNVISLNNKDFGRKSTVYSQSAGKNITVTEGINFSSNTSYVSGIRIFRFDNNAEFNKEITVDNPTDERIGNPIPIYIQHSENYLCLQYESYEKDVINERSYVYNLYDFDLKLISSIVYEHTGILTSLNDDFYLNTSINHGFPDFEMFKTTIPFKNNK